ncbi:MAG: hypothetical protein HWE18_15400 [Gammaproteobacteria bacterium]|nr:hypothetical protein [Gammaproteobacteria bacterium]
MMDIFGLPKRMMQQFGQLTQVDKAQPVSKQAPTNNADMALSSMSERIDYLAQTFDVKALEVKDILPLQSALTENNFIQPHQVRAQGLLTQLAYQHYQAGPMDLENALENHLAGLKEKTSVLADYKEGQHVLNVVRNLASAREPMHAA